MQIPPPLRSLIESGCHAHTVTLNADGESKSPRADGQCKALASRVK
ncbi:MAG: hypothetical protein HY867_08040 [Chloroflexi bacterium]|nr:hypothetical protein [Chloroflexota bacterium]